MLFATASLVQADRGGRSLPYRRLRTVGRTPGSWRSNLSGDYRRRHGGGRRPSVADQQDCRPRLRAARRSGPRTGGTGVRPPRHAGAGRGRLARRPVRRGAAHEARLRALGLRERAGAGARFVGPGQSGRDGNTCAGDRRDENHAGRVGGLARRRRDRLHPSPDTFDAPPSDEVVDREALDDLFEHIGEVEGLVQYIARRDGEVAGGGSLRMWKGVAQLCAGPRHSAPSTAAAFRRPSLRERLAEAQRDGCDSRS